MSFGKENENVHTRSTQHVNLRPTNDDFYAHDLLHHALAMKNIFLLGFSESENKSLSIADSVKYLVRHRQRIACSRTKKTTIPSFIALFSPPVREQQINFHYKLEYAHNDELRREKTAR